MRGHDAGHGGGEIARLQKSQEDEKQEDSLRHANFASFAHAHRRQAFGRNHRVLKPGGQHPGCL